MKKLFYPVVTLLMFCVLLSCEEKDCCVNLEGESNTLTGTWLLFERGYSPGAGYVIEPVSASPAQTLTFQSNGRMTATLDGLSDYKFYFIKDHPDPEQQIIALYKKYPGESPDPSTFTTSYHFHFDGNNLKLYYRYCIEGCHLALRKAE